MPVMWPLHLICFTEGTVYKIDELLLSLDSVKFLKYPNIILALTRKVTFDLLLPIINGI